MKHQQVTVDFVGMVVTAFSYLALAGAVWLFLRLLQACFWLPRHLQKQNDVQKMLQDKVDSYEKYILECEEKERTAVLEEDLENEHGGGKNIEQSEKWKERRECLAMLKRELNRVSDGENAYDWDYLLEKEGLKLDDEEFTEADEDEAANEKDEGLKENQRKESVTSKKEMECDDKEDKKDK